MLLKFQVVLSPGRLELEMLLEFQVVLSPGWLAPVWSKTGACERGLLVSEALVTIGTLSHAPPPPAHTHTHTRARAPGKGT